MQSADRVRELFKNGKLAVRPDADEQVFRDVLRAHNEAKTGEGNEHAYASVGLAPKPWRTMMRSPMTKLAIAAAIIIACLMGMMMWKGTGASVALADVLTQIQQVNAYMYQMTLNITGQKVGDRTINSDVYATILMSRDGAMKVTMNMRDPNGAPRAVQEMYLLPEKRTMLSLMPEAKRYLEVELDETRLQNELKANNNPRIVIQQILDCNYVSLGRSTIDGVAVDGFRTTDPRYMTGAMGQPDVKVWVDVKTQLPVRLEMDMQNGQMHMHYLQDNFQWDVSIDPKEFEPVIPPDYASMTNAPMKLPSMTEETAIQGLKLFAELGGRYPDELNIMTISSKLGELAAKELMKGPDGATLSKAEAAKRLQPDNEALKKLTEKMTPMAMPAAFYGKLVQENKDPAYYGKTVTPADADKVLLRWKVSESEYRVIFGNLSAQTVKADVLAELEKDLPK
jgi:outer membrane lipoprotein-sorting protein